jgi:hypothetical protein
MGYTEQIAGIVAFEADNAIPLTKSILVIVT